MIRFISISFIWLAFMPVSVFAEGQVEGLMDYQYWEDGKIRQCQAYNTSGRLTAKAFCRRDGTVEKLEKYDTYGNKIQECFIDQNRKLKTGIDGWAIMRWDYRDSKLAAQTSYDELGRPIERKVYSDGGNLIMRQFRDSERLNPTEEAFMATVLGPNNIPCKDPDE